VGNTLKVSNTMTRQQAQQLVNWAMSEGDSITRVDFYTNGPVVTIKRSSGVLHTLAWKKWGEKEEEAGWCLVVWHSSLVSTSGV